MSWDVSQAPRSARARAVNRQVPTLGASAEVYAVPPAFLTDQELEAILRTVPQLRMPSVLSYFIVSISRFYRYCPASAPMRQIEGIR